MTQEPFVCHHCWPKRAAWNEPCEHAKQIFEKGQDSIRKGYPRVKFHTDFVPCTSYSEAARQKNKEENSNSADETQPCGENNKQIDAIAFCDELYDYVNISGSFKLYKDGTFFDRLEKIAQRH